MTPGLYKNPSLVDFIRVCQLLPDDERQQLEAFTGEVYNAEQVAASFYLRSRAGLCWVLATDSAPLAIAGYEMVRTGVWQDWLLSTPDAWTYHWRTITKRCNEAMTAMLKTEAHRLQCVSLASRIHAHRWYRTIKLREEGTLQAYGAHGENAIMFARVRE